METDVLTSVKKKTEYFHVLIQNLTYQFVHFVGMVFNWALLKPVILVQIQGAQLLVTERIQDGFAFNWLRHNDPNVKEYV